MATNKIIGLFGQSNCVGRADMVDLPLSRQGYLYNLRVWDGNNFEVINHNLNNNQLGQPSNQFGIEFELRDYANFLNEDIYVCKFGKGGTALAADPGDDWNTTTDELHNTISIYIGRVNTWMNDRGKNFEWVAIIWIQGEKDAQTESYANSYQANEAALISAWNSDIGATPYWYICNLHSDSPQDYASTVRSAKSTNAASNSKYYLIDTDDCSLQDDNIHYDANGYITLGQKIVNGLKADIT